MPALKLLTLVLVLVAVFAAEIIASCPNNCSGVGTCVNNRCLCPQNRGGADCGVLVFPIGLGGPPQSDQWTGQTHYGKFETFKAQLKVGTGYTFTVHELSGRCQLFAGLGFVPSLYEYSYVSNIPRNDTLVINIRPETTEQAITYVGITALSWTTECQFRVEISLTSVVPNYQVVFTNRKYPVHLPSLKNESLNFLLLTGISSKPYTINMYSNCTNVLRLRYGAVPTPSYYYAVYYNYFTNTHYDIPANTNASLYFSLARVYSSSRTCVVEFNISQETESTCLSQCSLHGSCRYSSCVCDNGYYGIFCQLKETALRTSEVVSGFVDNGFANFYQYNSITTNPLYLYLNTTTGSNLTQNNASELCSFYVSKSSFPSPTNYDYSYNNIQNTYGPNVLIEIPQGGLQTWYMSVYGAHQCHYSLQVSSTSICGPGCEPPYGYCPSNSSGECECLGNWTGPDCRSTVENLNGDGKIERGSVATGKWNYYRIPAPANQGNWKISVTLVGDGTNLYVNEQSYPTLQGSTYKSIGSVSNQITVTNALPKGEYYYIGVFGAFVGLTPRNYQLSVFVPVF